MRVSLGRFLEIGSMARQIISRRPRQSVRLHLQTLESRLVPSTIVVNTTADNTAVDGKCSLREAITSVNNALDLNPDVAACRTGAYGSDTIVFDSALFSTPQTIALLSALPVITSDVAFQGTSASNVIVTRGATAIGLFACGANVSFSDMTITGGSTKNGAGIFVGFGRS